MEGMNGLERVKGGENGCRGLAVIFTQSLLGFHGGFRFFNACIDLSVKAQD